MKLVKVLIAGVALAVPSAAVASGAEEASAAFGYALQAMGSCDDYTVHMQTESKLEREYGVPLRGRNSEFRAVHMEGVMRFVDEESELGNEKACQNAWKRVGPSGSEYPGLLMDNPFR